MFCVKCGNEIRENDSFCSNCGAEIRLNNLESKEVVVEDRLQGYINASNKQLIINKLNEIRDVVYQAYYYYDIADNYEQKRSRIRFYLKDPKMIGYIIVMSLLGAGGKLFAGIWLIIAIVQEMKRNKNQQLAEENVEKGNRVFRENYEVVCAMDNEYLSPKAIDYIIRMIETDRSNTWNGVLSLCDEYLHRERVENEQRVHTAYLRTIEANSSEAAHAASAAAVNSFLGLFR